MTEFAILAFLAATLVIIFAMHHMKEKWFVFWFHVLFFGGIGGGILACGLLA